MPLKHVFFDVNETLTDFSQLTSAMNELGLSNSDLQLWFARLLRDGFAITLTQQAVNFAQIGGEGLVNLLQERGLPVDHEKINKTIGQVASLPAYLDVAPTIQRLKELGLELSTLTNGSTAAAEFLFNSLDLTNLISNFLSVQNNAQWKPHSAAYEFALTKTGASSNESILVAAHPWDIHGANQAGLASVWINRKGITYPNYFSPPTATITQFSELPEAGQPHR